VTEDPTPHVPFAGIDGTPSSTDVGGLPADAPSPIGLPPIAGLAPHELAPFSVPPASALLPEPPPSRSLSKWTWLFVGIGALSVIVGIVILSTSDYSGPAEVSTPPIGSVVAPTDGVAFKDPQGSYTIELQPGWTRMSGTPVKEIEAWSVGFDSAGFTPNVTVVTQDSQGMDLAKYMQASLDELGAGHLDYSTTVTGVHGNQLGVLEYHGLVGTSTTPLHFLAVFEVRDGQAVVATLTTTDSRFPVLRKEAEPYLRTLQAT
jgi:hypothetical protein